MCPARRPRVPAWCSEEVSGAGAQGWKGEGQECQRGRHAGGPGAGARSRDSTLGQRGAMGEYGAELGPGHSLVQVRKTGWGLAICQEATVKSREETTREWMEDGGDRMVGKDVTFQVGPGPCRPLGKKPEQSRAGPGWGVGQGGECAGVTLSPWNPASPDTPGTPCSP